MMRSGVLFTGIAAGVAASVALVGSTLVPGSLRVGVWAGAAAGFACQAAFFWLFFVVAFPGRQLMAHLLGMLGRMGVLGITALVWAPLAGLPLAPTLFALATVLFLSTLAEPLVLRLRGAQTHRQAMPGL